MNKSLIFLVLLVVCGGCSSAETIQNKQVAVKTDDAVNSANHNSNAKLIPKAGVDPEAFNRNSADLPVVHREQSNSQPTYGPRPAPDNSTFNTVQLPDGSFEETRLFKAHPQILKVVKKTNGKNVSLKVYLKNGKAVETSEEKLQNFRVAAPGNILLAIGIKPIAPSGGNVENKKVHEDSAP